MAGSEVARAAIWYLVGDPGWDPTEPEGPCLHCHHHLHQVRHLVHLVLLVVDVVVHSRSEGRPRKWLEMVSRVKVLLVLV